MPSDVPMVEPFAQPPGSDEAVEAGCTCPIMDNAHGRGVGNPEHPDYWISGDCPLHGGGTDG